MKLRLTLLLLVLFAVGTPKFSYAQKYEYPVRDETSIRTATQVNQCDPANMLGCDTIQAAVSYYSTPSVVSHFHVKNLQSYVRFFVDHNYPLLQQAYTYKILYQVKGYKDFTGTAVDQLQDTLFINYHPDSTQLYQDIHQKTYYGYYKLDVKITAIYDYTAYYNAVVAGTTPPPPDLVFPVTPAQRTIPLKLNWALEVGIRQQKVDLDVPAGTTYNPAYDPAMTGVKLWADLAVSPTGPLTQLPVQWGVLKGQTRATLPPQGAQYELEWTYVDDYQITIDPNGDRHVSTKATPAYDFRENATRIRTNAPNYTIPLLYKRGWIVYRVRMLRPQIPSLGRTLYSDWSNPADYGTVTTASGFYHIEAAHRGDIANWTYEASYAEEGKSKQVLSYFDGMMKNRQSLTRFQSRPQEVIGLEKFYDYEGRPALQTLPIPVTGVSTFTYLPSFAQKANGDPYTAADFDGLVTSPLPALGANAQANGYYSSQNPLLGTPGNTHIKAVPSAGGYPLIQTRAEAYDPSRIRLQGGAGPTFQIGSGHETRYLYADPEQEELNLYFGAGIGLSRHYEKVVTKDPNNEMSFSILNNAGQPVMTGLMGFPDAANQRTLLNLDGVAIPSANNVTSNIFSGNPPLWDRNVRNLHKSFISEVSGGTLQYGVSVGAFNPCTPSTSNLKLSIPFEVQVRYRGETQDTFTTADRHTLTPANSGVNGTYAGTSMTGLSHASSAIAMNNLQAGESELQYTLRYNPDVLDTAVRSFLRQPQAYQPSGCYQSRDAFNVQYAANLPDCEEASGTDGLGYTSKYDEDGNPGGTIACVQYEKILITQLLPKGTYGKYRRTNTLGIIAGNGSSIFSIVGWKNGAGTPQQPDPMWPGQTGSNTLDSSITPAIWPTIFGFDPNAFASRDEAIEWLVQNGYKPIYAFQAYLEKRNNRPIPVLYNHTPTLITKDSSADFLLEVCDRKVASELLEMHPEYCRMRRKYCDFTGFIGSFKALPNARVARSRGLFYAQDIIKRDPIQLVLSQNYTLAASNSANANADPESLKLRLTTQILPQDGGTTTPKRIGIEYLAYTLTVAQTLPAAAQKAYLEAVFNQQGTYKNIGFTGILTPVGYYLLEDPITLRADIDNLSSALQDTFFRKLQGSYVATQGLVAMQVELPYVICDLYGLKYIDDKEEVFKKLFEKDEPASDANPNSSTGPAGMTLADLFNGKYNPSTNPSTNTPNTTTSGVQLDDLRTYARQIVKSLINCRSASSSNYNHTLFVRLEDSLVDYMLANQASRTAKIWKGGLSSTVLKTKLRNLGFQLDGLCNPYLVDYKTSPLLLNNCEGDDSMSNEELCSAINLASMDTSFLKRPLRNIFNAGFFPNNNYSNWDTATMTVQLRKNLKFDKLILDKIGYYEPNPLNTNSRVSVNLFYGSNHFGRLTYQVGADVSDTTRPFYFTVDYFVKDYQYVFAPRGSQPYKLTRTGSTTFLTNEELYQHTNYNAIRNAFLPACDSGYCYNIQCHADSIFKGSDRFWLTSKFIIQNDNRTLYQIRGSDTSVGMLADIDILIRGFHPKYLFVDSGKGIDPNSKSCVKACIACNEFKEAYEKYRQQVADSFGIQGAGHPNYETSVRSFFNYYFRKENNTSTDYLNFMKGCNLAESEAMPLYKGYLQAHGSASNVQTVVDAITNSSSTSAVQAPFALPTDPQALSLKNISYLRYEDNGGLDHLYIDGRSLPQGSRLRPFLQGVPQTLSWIITLNQPHDGSTTGPEVADLLVQGDAVPLPASMTVTGLTRTQEDVTVKYGGTGPNDPAVSRPFVRLRYTPPASASIIDRIAAWGALKAAWEAWQRDSSLLNTYELFPQENYRTTHRNAEAEKTAYLNRVYNLPPTMPHDQVLYQLSASVLQNNLYSGSGKKAGYLHGISTETPNDPSGTLQLTLANPLAPPAGWNFLSDLLTDATFSRANLTGNQITDYFKTSTVASDNITHEQAYFGLTTPPPSTLHKPTASYQNITYELGTARRIQNNVYTYSLVPTGAASGSRMYHIYLRLPPYINRNQSWEYALDVARLEPFPMGESKRYFRARFVRPGFANDTFWAVGKTNFDLTADLPQRYTNVMLCDNRENEATDSIDICYDRQITNALAQAEAAWQQYQDSLYNDIRGRYHDFITQSCRDSLLLTLGQMKYAVTLYQYDRAGNLMRTVPPMGVHPLTNTSGVDAWRNTQPANVPAPEPVHTKVTAYQYNAQNLKVYENTPDAGTTEYIYDQAGRLLLSQNSQQRTDSKYSYNLYDKQNRLIETGQVYVNPNPTRGLGQTFGLTTLSPAFIAQLKAAPTANYNTFHSALRVAAREEVIRTTYDTALYALEQPNNGLSNGENLRSRISSVATYPKLAAGQTTYPGYEVALHYSYDLSGNVKTLTYDMPGLSAQRQQYKRIDYDYDLYSGKVTLVSYNRSFGDQFYQRYRYDDDNRITATETSKDGILWDLDAQYKYYPHGPLARISLGDQKVQGIDFAYTLQGWLKSINGDAPGTAQDIGGDGTANSIYKPDLLKTTLHYFDGDYTAIDPTNYAGTSGSKMLRMPAPDAANRSLYNGNIAAMTTAPGYFPALHSTFRYDKLNRIKEATNTFPDYSQTGDPMANAGSNPHGITGGVGDLYKSTYTYDLDGNLQGLNRWGFNTANTSSAQNGVVYQLDALSYLYQAGTTMNNRLTNFTETIASHSAQSGNFTNDIAGYNPGNAATAGRLQYDAAGNLIQDASNGLDSIKWNHYGKTTLIAKDNGMKLRFSYDPLGNRWKKTIQTGTFPNEQYLNEYYIRDAAGNELATYRHQQRYGRQVLSADLDPVLGGGSGGGGGVIKQVGDAAGAFSAALLEEVQANDLPYVDGTINSTPVRQLARRSGAVRQVVLDSVAGLASTLVASDSTLQQALYPASVGSLEPFGTLLRMPVVIDSLTDSATVVVARADSAARVRGAVVLLGDAGVADRYVRLNGLDTAGTYTAQQLGGYLAEDLATVLASNGPEAGAGLLRQVVGSGRAYDQSVSRLLSDTGYTALGGYNAVLAQRLGAVEDSLLIEHLSEGLQAALGSGSTGSALRDWVPTEALAGLAYEVAGADFVDGLLATSAGKEQVTNALGSLGLGSMLKVVNGLSTGGLNVSLIEPVLSQGLLEDKFYLADQVLYGSSRLGVKTYLPSQYQYYWNNTQSLAKNKARWDSSEAAYRMPWYSDAVQSLMRYDAMSPYATAQSDGLWSSRIIGLKRYELTNHLGNVLGVVSDKVTEAVTTLNSGPYKVERASLKAAYDYYPFGMLMPGRYVEDGSVSCVPVSKTRYITERVRNTVRSSLGSGSITLGGVGLGGSVVTDKNTKALLVERGAEQEPDKALEVAMPLGSLSGSDLVGVDVAVQVAGEGEIYGELRWYPGGWSEGDEDGQGAGPVGDANAYEVLDVAMVPDEGTVRVRVGDADNPMPVAMKTNGALAVVLRGVNVGSTQLAAEYVDYYDVIRAVQSYVVLSCDTDGVWNSSYSYGFNGQRKVDEVSGIGNHNTATFWEYDTRLGRRWNLDPRPQVRISDYAVNGLNPIANNDPKGDIFKVQTKQAEGSKTASCVPKGRVTDPGQSQAQRDVRGVAGKYGDLVSFSEDGTVSLDIAQIGKNIEDPVAKAVEVARVLSDPGLAVINDLVNSEKSFYFGTEKSGDIKFSDDQGKSWHLGEWKLNNAIPGKVIDPKSTGSGENLFSKFAQNLNGQPSVEGSNEQRYRPAGYDGAVYMPNAEYRIVDPRIGTYIVPRASNIYHELRENYLRVTGIEPYYSPAHDRAVKDEGDNYNNKYPGVVNEVQFK